jgi:hypothetical protein
MDERQPSEAELKAMEAKAGVGDIQLIGSDGKLEPVEPSEFPEED